MGSFQQIYKMNRLDIFFKFYFVTVSTIYCDFLTLQASQNTLVSSKSAVYCSENTSITVEYTQNVLRCARKCQNDISCKGVVYNEQNLLCEVVSNENLADCSPKMSGTIFGVTSRAEKQNGKWKRVVSFGADGTVTFGNISTLKHAVLSGQWLQVNFGTVNGIIYIATINTVTIIDDDVCAQSNDFIFHTQKTKIVSFLICTDGITQSIRRGIGTSKVQSFQYFTNSSWFVRESDYMQVMVDSDGRSTSAIYSQLDVKQAFILTIVQKNNAFTKINYKTYTNLLDFSKTVTITSHGEISKVVNGRSVVYAEEKTWLTSKYNFTSSINEVVCNMYGNMSCESKVNTVNQKAFIDWNWEKVFHHTADGNAVFGSISSIRINTMKAQRLLIHCEGNIREPNIVVDVTTNVAAFFTSYPTKQNNSDNAEIVWEMLTTSGRYELLVFDASSGDILSESNETRECIWFVDKVTWTKVHDWKYNTNEGLLAAVESGSSIRIKVNCLADNTSSSSTSYTCLYGSSVIQIYTVSKKVTTRTNLFPGIAYDNLGLHLAKQRTAIWMNFNLVSFGNISRLRRNVLTHENSYFDSTSYIYGDTIMINDEWFAN